MSVYEDLINKNEKLCVIGLGYVGMPIAIAFAKQIEVIGYDVNKEKIALYKSGIDPTKEVGNEIIKNTGMLFTDNEKNIQKAKFHIIAVPTPVNQDKTPDLSPVESSSRIVGRNLTKGSYVVYESTVYPGVTEDICIPILEQESGLKNGVDFKVGYSPERINPGDKIHTLETIVKIVSGQDRESLEEIAKVYELIIKAGVYRASSIRIAEAAKVVENSQRDINIAFMNELAMVFNRMKIDTKEVIDAMNTKWNSLGFTPGLVGGHCIGVDPYYFIYQAEKLGYHSQIILSGRKINDSMGGFIAENIIKQLVLGNNNVKNSKVGIFGITFKENCPDIRNSKVVDIISKLEEYGVRPIVCDPYANPEECFKEYGVVLEDERALANLDCVVLAVAHKEYRERTISDWINLLHSDENSDSVIIDVKSVMSLDALKKSGLRYWRL